MKKIINIFNIMLMLAVASVFHACGDDVEYTPAEALSNAQVYFPSTNSATIDVSKSKTSFDVAIMRIKTDEAQTVNITATGGEGIYTIPSTASFAEGENSTFITIGYNPEDVEYDTYSEITLKLSDETITTPYGMSEYTFSVGIPAPWVSRGECTFVEDFVTTFFAVDNEPYAVEIEENELQPGYFRLVNPFGAAYPYNEEGDWDASQDWYLEIHAEDPEAVYMDVQQTGMDWGYGMFYVGSIAGYYMAQGATLDEMKAQGYTGTYKDGIISFPASSMLVGMANYNDGGLYTANGNGAFRVAMPGVVLADYSLGVAYAGKYTSAKGEDAGVLAQLTEVGEDIESIRLAVVEGTDVNKAVESIRNGAIESVEVTPDAGTVMVPFASEPVTGVYTLVAVGYAGNVAEASASAEFDYTNAPAETWTAISTGDYVYTLFFVSEDGPYTDQGLTLYQSNEDPTRYKIEHWGNDVDFIFTYNEATGEVMVEDQEVGYVHPQYGTVFVDDIVDYAGTKEMGFSYFEDGVFHFAVIYYVNEGNFGYGEETFTLTNNAGSETATTRAFSAPKSGKTVQPFSIQKQFRIKKMNSAFPIFK